MTRIDYFLIFLVKIWIENGISIRKVIIMEWKRQRRGRGSGVEWGWSGGRYSLMINLWLISHRWYDVAKLTVPSSSDLNLIFSWSYQKFFVKKMNEKCVIFFIINLSAKVSLKPSGEGWLFCANVRYRLSKLIFTKCVSRNSRKVKQEIITRNWKYKLPQELTN